jgi:hypothetical protein
MIRYALRCQKGCEFEAWFGSIADFDKQAAKRQIECPECGDTHVEKAPMAPAIGMTKSDKRAAWARSMVRRARREIAENYEYVGDKFTSEARRIHEGEIDERPIWGEASLADAKEMIEDGVPVAPLPDEIAPAKPKKRKDAKVN